MSRIAVAIAAVAVIAVAAAAAPESDSAAPDTENGRYTLHQVPGGMLRLDARTGEVSLCSRRDAGWACQLVPDDRAVLEGEIARLQRANSALKRELIARGIPLPGGMKPDARRYEPKIELKLPSDEELDRVMSFMEKVWRRLIGMMQSVQKDMEKKG